MDWKTESFLDIVKKDREKLQVLTPEPIEEKDVNYGIQLKVKNGPDTVSLTIYNGKKGLKYVWGGSEVPFKELCRQALSNKGINPNMQAAALQTPVSSGILLDNVPHFDGLWAGSDESGKGDFIGPLVVAAVVIDTETAFKFQAMGVRDSKDLSDKKIHELAKSILALARNTVVLPMKPAGYNLRIAQLKEQKKTLNDFLASGHTNALARAIAGCPQCRFALVDQFSRRNSISSRLEGQYPGLKVYQKPRAERDMAVAAASILARDAFVEIMKELSRQAGFELPKGGGEQAAKAARRLAKEQGRENLKNFVKLHFKNMERV